MTYTKHAFNKKKLVQVLRNISWALMLFSSTSMAALDAKYFDQIDHIAFNGNANGRGSVNFYGRKNIQAVIPKASKAKVVKGSATKLPSGAWALKVKVEELGSTSGLGARAANTTSEYWVRYAEGSSYMTLVDKDNRITAQAEDASRARINRDTPAALIPVGASDLVVTRPAAAEAPRLLAKPSATAADSAPYNPITEIGRTVQRLVNPQAAVCVACEVRSPGPFNVIREVEGAIQQSVTPTEIEALISAYTSSAGARNLQRIAGRERRTGGGGRCYSDVKDDLENAGLINQSAIDHLGLASSGFMAEAALEKQGFVDLLDSESYVQKYGTDPRKAPCGSVLVYRGGPKGHGHAETVVCEGNQRRYVSDFRATQPISLEVGEDVANLGRYMIGTRNAHRNRYRELRGARELTGIMIKDLRNTAPPVLASR